MICIEGLSTAIDLPEPVDGIVSEIHGALPMFEGSLAAILDARDRLMKPGGWIVPSRESIWAAIVPSRSIEPLLTNWETAFGFDFSGAAARAVNMLRQYPVTPADLVAEPQCWATLDYAVLQSPNVAGELSWTVEREGVAHGLSMWFDCETAPAIGFNNSPLASEQHVFGQVFFPWTRPTALGAGDRGACQAARRLPSPRLHLDVRDAYRRSHGGVEGALSAVVVPWRRESAAAGRADQSSLIRVFGSSFGGRGPWRTAPATGT